jgi:hypothetical protein
MLNPSYKTNSGNRMTINKNRVDALKSSIYDFFWIQFDERTANQVKKYPERAIQILKEYMSNNHIPRSRLELFGRVIEDILELHTIREESAPKSD